MLTAAVSPRAVELDLRTKAPCVAAALAFLVLFRSSAITLLGDWWSEPDAGHGLLLGPLAVYLAWRAGRSDRAKPQPMLGLTFILVAVTLRYVAELAAEQFTLRVSMLVAGAGLVVFGWGVRQLLHWWLPILLIALSVPLPTVVLESLALPLQLQASELGASLLRGRYVPVALAGNVIHMPGRSLFVTEACSGLRSLTALIALGVLVGGFWLRTPLLRVLLVAAAVPIAVLLNGIRIFVVGFLVYYVDPRLGEGVLHYTEGWLIFAVAFGTLGAMAWGAGLLERRFSRA